MNKASAKKKYERIWHTTADVIREWDPYCLLAGESAMSLLHVPNKPFERIGVQDAAHSEWRRPTGVE